MYYILIKREMLLCILIGSQVRCIGQVRSDQMRGKVKKEETDSLRRKRGISGSVSVKSRKVKTDEERSEWVRRYSSLSIPSSFSVAYKYSIRTSFLSSLSHYIIIYRNGGGY